MARSSGLRLYKAGGQHAPDDRLSWFWLNKNLKDDTKSPQLDGFELIFTVKSRLFQVSRNEGLLFISSHEESPLVPQLPYRYWMRPAPTLLISSKHSRAFRENTLDFDGRNQT